MYRFAKFSIKFTGSIPYPESLKLVFMTKVNTSRGEMKRVLIVIE